jgi:D-glycero-D-manno-heptose 1,7-bisphosphate phosphatase
MTTRAAVIFDRDGVLNELVARGPGGQAESPLRPVDVRLTEGVAGQLHRARAAGFLLACVTNQPSAAKGLLTVADVQEIQDRVLTLLATDGFVFDAVRMCLHHPHGRIPELCGPCDCRKPAPGMLLSVAEDLGVDLARSWMIGDTDGDVLAGQAAGTRTIVVAAPGSAHKRTGDVVPDMTVATLAEAVGVVVGDAGLR